MEQKIYIYTGIPKMLSTREDCWRLLLANSAEEMPETEPVLNQ